MSGTQRISPRSNVLGFPLPRFLRRRQPALTDGLLELAVAYDCLELMLQLPATSQMRAMQHMEKILLERMQQLSHFEGSEIPAE